MAEVVDPITLEVVCEGLIAIVREMRAAVNRASYSPVIWELDDFSCALIDPQAQMVAQYEDHPGHVLPMPWSVRCAMEDFAGDIRPGDVILLNGPYRGGTHLNDVTLLYPVFEEGELFIFADESSERGHDLDGREGLPHHRGVLGDQAETREEGSGPTRSGTTAELSQSLSLFSVLEESRHQVRSLPGQQ